MKNFKKWYTIFSLILGNQNGNVLMGGGDGGSGSNDGGDGGSSGSINGDSSGGDGGAGGDGGSAGGADDIMYPDGLDEGLRGNPTLLKFYDKESKNFKVPNMMKALVHASSMIGADKIQKPQSSWTEEQWRDYDLASGLPESVDGYEIKNVGLPENAQADEKFFNNFKEQAYAAGIRPQQAEKLVGWFNNMQAQQAEVSKVQKAQEYQIGKQKLENQYGTKLKGALQRGDHALSTIASSEEIVEMQNSGLTDNPAFANFLIKVADMFGEKNAFNDEANASYGMTPEEATVEMEKMMQKDHPYQASKDPKVRAMYRDKWMNYAKIKSMGRKSSGQSGQRNAIM